MRPRLLALLFVLTAAAETPAPKLWSDLKAKRDQIPSLHQQFEVSRTFFAHGATQSHKWRMTLDLSRGQWRERSSGGAGTNIKIFDGADLYSMEEGGEEYVLTSNAARRASPVPTPYPPPDSDWSKAVEAARVPCGISGSDHQCVLLHLPAPPWARTQTTQRVARMIAGTQELLVDLENGVMIYRRVREEVNENDLRYVIDTTYQVRKMTYDSAADPSLFTLPAGLRKVKELPRWSVATIRKRLTGKPAPPLDAIDIQGNPLTLDSFKGKIVLLDFWATWCRPCRMDSPELDRLYNKYSNRDLVIVAISVNESRATVEKFLKQHPHAFPTVLSSENEVPHPYQVSALPTYIVIDRDGGVTTAVVGGQGFQGLGKLLRGAGLEVD